ncbi:pleckstrin homology domain-containing family S member 1 [Callorhinchus milii]|uniref:PH domain-containing protein n=1 Tax=Callorhinchus milii TaxID=7868 RepID=A0A4W3I6U1_CALMI|nr:pleckstrin homology domain-containing family S member 1 [Callorhinchus milii]|eukprot:gi/632974746/ref/XP_007903847.1/ PREDICTED: pleckstrin homology domain-containing family S member 1 [Callorhinchus milii]
MQRKERSSSIFYATGANFFEGCLQKSPPINKFTSQTSWKKRYFVLREESDEYILKYYKNRDEKSAKALGEIPIKGIKEMDIGPQHHAKWKTLEKMFKCTRERVIFLKTEGREYFFIGEKDQVKDLQQKILNLKNISPVEDQPNYSGRFHGDIPHLQPEASSTNNSHTIYSTISETLAEVERKRGGETKLSAYSAVDPPETIQCIYDVPKNILEAGKQRPYSDVTFKTSSMTQQFRQTVVEEKPRASSVSAVSSNTSGATYDTPRKIVKSCRSQSYDSGIYMSMASIPEMKAEERPCLTTDLESTNLTSRISSSEDLLNTETLPQQSLAASLKGKTEWDMNLPTHTRQLKALNRDVIEEKKPEKLDRVVSKKEVQFSLSFSEPNGSVCVTHSSDAKCAFCHGDIITAINKLQISTIEEVYMFVQKAVEEEVTISILRQPGATTFHCEECVCEDNARNDQTGH